MPSRVRPSDVRESLVIHVNTSLTRVNELCDTISLPPELAVALATGRPELIKLARPRPLEEKEVAALYHAIAVLIETNQLLQQHVNDLAHLAEIVATSLKGAVRQANEIALVGRFKSGQGGGEDGGE